jgi:hypothetical protein
MLGKSWLLRLTFKQKATDLAAEVVYESNQILRIKVFGNNRAIVLQVNYPLVKASRFKKRWSWKLVEGKAPPVELFDSIINRLERILKLEAEKPPPIE